MSVASTAFGQLMKLAGREAPDFVTIDEGAPACGAGPRSALRW